MSNIDKSMTRDQAAAIKKLKRDIGEDFDYGEGGKCPRALATNKRGQRPVTAANYSTPIPGTWFIWEDGEMTDQDWGLYFP